jgi:hypothetical protein
MKKITNSPYATNKGGKIDAPNGKPKDEPKAKRIVSIDDLRNKRSK